MTAPLHHSTTPDLFSADPADPEVRYLEELLAAAGQAWTLSGDVRNRALVELQKRWDTRRIVHLAAASADIISGQHGYKHLQHATPEEIAHFENVLASKQRSLEERRQRIRRRAHQIFG